MKTLLIFLAVFALSGSPALAQMPPRMITVSGEASEDVAPDRAILSLSLASRDTDLSKAKRDNDQMVEKLVTIARDFKIPKEKIATSGMHIAPEYDYDKGQRRFRGYMVSRSLQMTMDDLSIHERVLSAVVDAKIDQVNGVQFTLADQEAHAKTVRVKAVENARERASALAAAAGAKLGQVMMISTTGTAPMPMPYPRMEAMAMQADGGSVAPSLPGMITLSESVTVSFALE